MDWLHAHHRIIGLFADVSTFLGGFLLARDAFLRLRELKKSRTDFRFRKEFPGLNLTDAAWREAIVSVRWTLGGFVLIAAGFACQLILRFVEP